MKEITLNLTACKTREALHGCIRQALSFPAYYGMNLDALADMLTSLSQPLRLIVCYPATPCDALADYWPRLLRVLDNAALENENLQIIYREE